MNGDDFPSGAHADDILRRRLQVLWSMYVAALLCGDDTEAEEMYERYQQVCAPLCEKLADIETRILAFDAVDNDEVCLALLREQTRLRKIINGRPS